MGKSGSDGVLKSIPFFKDESPIHRSYLKS